MAVAGTGGPDWGRHCQCDRGSDNRRGASSARSKSRPPGPPLVNRGVS